ncbi:hypothetical protein [Asticcacaulis benevestitus]|uniref:Uncharacterized protein n=1 Tax=Asticcacaulis benevestitus DSM 16100 = ATCC BAA-896 TaxID=1121022 RepID=V4Q9A9_9CAUL|nr:hypothetical protein [Asticcacaulis benevestitus]ESQ94450.1 hypothetical protein ABENE_01120 [Asticcacaulis benevestitus DSM 16100 = ATCC BAA-896]
MSEDEVSGNLFLRTGPNDRLFPVPGKGLILSLLGIGLGIILAYFAFQYIDYSHQTYAAVAVIGLIVYMLVFIKFAYSKANKQKKRALRK